MRVTKGNETEENFNTYQTLWKEILWFLNKRRENSNVLMEGCPFTMLSTWISFSVEIFTSSNCWIVIFSAVISIIFTASSWPVCLCTHLRTTLLTPLTMSIQYSAFSTLLKKWHGFKNVHSSSVYSICAQYLPHSTYMFQIIILILILDNDNLNTLLFHSS